MWDKSSIGTSVPSAGLQLKCPGSRRAGEKSASSCPRAVRLNPCEGRRCRGAWVLVGARAGAALGGRQRGGGSRAPAVAPVCAGAGQGTATSYRRVGSGKVPFARPSCDPRACSSFCFVQR